MKKWTMGFIWALVAAFVIYYLYTRPEAAAEFVRSVFSAVDSLGRFFNKLAG